MSMTAKHTLTVLGVVLAIFTAFTLRHLTVIPPAVDQSSPFNTERAMERLVRILGDESPHPVDSDANDAVRERIVAEIELLGFEPVVRDDFFCNPRGNLTCARVRNILFWVTEPGPDAVMLASHYDSVPPGPGAADDASGVVSSLEIADILRGRDLDRPVLVLITDGEEGGLIGAGSFVANDPVAAQVGAVVSMEARGVRGTSALIQTSRPNGRDIGVLTRGHDHNHRLPVASSLNADIYELLPNDTDVTMYLELGIDAANLAFANGAAYYHTPYDNIANLDRRTFQHQGITALRAVEVYAAQDTARNEGQFIYTDVMGLFAIALPQSWSLIVIGLGLMATVYLFFATPNGAPIRTFLAPPLALIVGLGFAIGVTMLIAALRPETGFASAHPWALRGVHNAAALLGGLLVFAFLLRPGPSLRMVAAGWFWYALIGIGGILLLPGTGILFVPLLAVIVLVAVLAAFQQLLAARLAAGFAALLFLIITLPLTATGEVGLFVESAAPFAFAPVFLGIVAIPLFWPSEGLAQTGRLVVAGGAGLLLAVFAGLALSLPAYTLAAPQSVSMVHLYDQDTGDVVWAIRDGEPLPSELTEAFEFTPSALSALTGNWLVTTAPEVDVAPVSITILSDEVMGDTRVVELGISAPDADRLLIPMNDTNAVLAMTLNDSVGSSPEDQFRGLICYGRSCRSLKLTLTLDTAEPTPDLRLIAVTHGLGTESSALLEARPPWAVPQHWGDLRIVAQSLGLESGNAN